MTIIWRLVYTLASLIETVKNNQYSNFEKEFLLSASRNSNDGVLLLHTIEWSGAVLSKART